MHWHLCAQYAYRVAPSPVQVEPARRATPPADNRPRLVDVRRLRSTSPPSGYETCGDGRHQPPMPVIPCSRTEAAPFATPRPGCACRLGPDSPAGGSLRARQVSDPVRPVFDSGPHRPTSGVPSWLDSACGMLTVKKSHNGCGKENPRYPVGITGIFWLRG